MSDRPIISRSSPLQPQATRRPGLAERRLLGPAQSRQQNVVLFDAEAGSIVAEHPVSNSESLFVLTGQLEITGPGFVERLQPGDLCHFAGGMIHGLRVLVGPARFLAIFAPARAGLG